jgi:phenylacetate-CoA ligase
MQPSLVKHVLFPLHEKIMGRETLRFLQDLELLQWKPQEELEELKFRKLKELLLHAQRNIPFYADRFATAGFNPAKMQCIDDFKVLPLLTKKEIRENLEDLKWKNCPGGLHRYNTGGSSGEPLIFYFDRRRQAYDAAARALAHRWWNVDIGDRELYLWGSPLEISKQDRVKSFRDRLMNQLLISAFEISPRQVPWIVKQIETFKPKCIFGYPSTIHLFCRMAAKEKLNLKNLGVEVIFCTAEMLYEHLRQEIRHSFGGIPVADGYGSREGGFISHECSEGIHHIMDPNYVIEFINNGKEASNGEDGEITITHLDAWGMPFIRYVTGDVGRAGAEKCRCGRGFSTISAVQGRVTDFLVTPDGRWQHALSVIYILRDIEGVVEFRIIQKDVDDIRVLLRTHEDRYPKDGNEQIVRGIKKRMGESIGVTIEPVQEMPKDASGKYRYVVSHVAQKGFN